tara:strand:- start:1008 stop:1652 length:645 start_codon:yes stop_codon:yes gene_type:complete
MSKQGIRVFCDMDGVVADFTQGVKDLSGVILTTSKADHARYDTMKEELTEQNLFRDLPQTKMCKALIATLNELCSQEYIVGFEMLTAAGRVNRNIVVADKLQWCKENGLEGVPVTCVFSGKDKGAYVAPQGLEISILIDDREDNCKLWKEAGGIALLIDDKSTIPPEVLVRKCVEWVYRTYQNGYNKTLDSEVIDLSSCSEFFIEGDKDVPMYG